MREDVSDPEEPGGLAGRRRQAAEHSAARGAEAGQSATCRRKAAGGCFAAGPSGSPEAGGPQARGTSGRLAREFAQAAARPPGAAVPSAR